MYCHVMDTLYSFLKEESSIDFNALASCVSSTLQMVFPTRASLAHAFGMQQLRKAAKERAGATGTRTPFPSLNLFWDFWKRQGANHLLEFELLREKVWAFLAIDLFARPSDLACIPCNSLQYFYFRPDSKHKGEEQLVLHLVNPKSHPVEVIQCSVDPVPHERTLCTVAAVRELMCRPQFSLPTKATIELPRRSTKEVAGVPPSQLMKLPAFCRSLKLKKGATSLEPVGSQRISKIIMQSFSSRGAFAAGFNGKDVRSLAASLAFNLGVPTKRLMARGRWSSAHTVVHHYIREVRIRQYDPKRVEQLSMAEVLRIRTSAVN